MNVYFKHKPIALKHTRAHTHTHTRTPRKKNYKQMLNN